jgi:hypothetical protein
MSTSEKPRVPPLQRSVSWKKKKAHRRVLSSYEPEEDPSVQGFDTGLRYRTLSKTKSSVFLPRLVERNLTYHQSKNNMSVNNINGKRMIWPLLLSDWFHVLLRVPFQFSIIGLLFLWTSMILLFAGFYVWVDKSYENADCGLGDPGDPIAWGTAFAFSLETCTTVGCKFVAGCQGAAFLSVCRLLSDYEGCNWMFSCMPLLTIIFTSCFFFSRWPSWCHKCFF